MRKLAVIIAHCDTYEKLHILDSNLNILNNDDNLDILLVSYLPIDSKILDKVNYFVYDRNNPIIEWPEKGIFDGGRVHTPFSLHSIMIDYGFCVANQMKMAGDFLNGKKDKYDALYFMNYDVKLKDDVINLIQTGDAENTIFTGINYQGKAQLTCLVFMSFKFNDYLKFTNKISRKGYLSKSNRVAETYVEDLLNELKTHTHHKGEVRIYDHIDFFEKNYNAVYNSVNKNEEFEIFITSPKDSKEDFKYWNKDVKTNHSLIYNVRVDITLKINNIEYNIPKNTYLMLPRILY